ncbi:hypothetical protein J3A78_002385 [Streptomyces sp. PvR006]|uniref:hypothetical protein n=1 Tax=Streptomyces sp. PvR006 TaxID=2817860 RepID=UPI001AEA3188|nr:hypothetical protein [Streptomyces sp. PvR006]MBP2581907.1 hypothetical protein [Streptomyces sp. PvR006]
MYQTTYRATRAHMAALAATIKPGDRLYIQHDGQEREFIVTGDTGTLGNVPLVTPAGHGSAPSARIPIHQLLARFGAIHIRPPDQP